MAKSKSMSNLDVNRAIRFPATVMSGEFNLATDDHNYNGRRKRRDEVADADVEDRRAAILRNLLLRPDRLRNFKIRGRAEALICQHRAIWGDRRRMQQLDQTARELQEYFSALPDAILGERARATTDGGVIAADQTLLFVFCANEDHAASEEKLKCERFGRRIEVAGARDAMMRDIEREMARLSSIEAAIASDVEHLQLQSDGTGAGALVAAEESGQGDRMNLNHSGRRRESVATSGYLSDENESTAEDIEEGKLHVGRDGSQQCGALPQSSGLEKICASCGSRLLVTINLDNLDTADSKKWLRHNCPQCRHQENGGLEEEDDDEDAVDALESALRQVVSDIGDYYEKKIQMLQIRADRIRASRPPAEQVELVERLQLVYRGHPNYGELWTDMFARMTNTHGPTQAKLVERWMISARSISQSFRAAVRDLKRERDRVLKEIRKSKVARHQRDERRSRFEGDKARQEELCAELKNALVDLRNQRERRQKEETILRERFEQEAEMATRGNERREAERRWANKVKVHNHRKIKAAEERRRAEELESEVAAMAGRKRERALQDYIRVNIRKVMREKRREEAEESSKAEQMEAMAAEARLESLRRLGRRRLGLDFMSLNSKSLTDPTVAHAQRVRATEEEGWATKFDVAVGRPIYRDIDGYGADQILGDARLIVESVLREKGLLAKNCGSHAARAILDRVRPPSKPRPEMVSQIHFDGVETRAKVVV